MAAAGNVRPTYKPGHANYKVRHCLKCGRRFKARVYGEREYQRICDPCKALNDRGGGSYI